MVKVKCDKCGSDIECTKAIGKAWIWATVVSTLIFFMIVFVFSLSEQKNITPKSTEQDEKNVHESNSGIVQDKKQPIIPFDISKALAFEVIRLQKFDEDEPRWAGIHVEVKITNISKQPIKSALVSCVMKDRQGNPIAFTKEDAIGDLLSDSIVLLPSNSTYHSFAWIGYPLNMTQAECHTESIEWYEKQEEN